MVARVAEVPSTTYSEQMPLYPLTLFAKGDRANLSKSDRNELAN